MGEKKNLKWGFSRGLTSEAPSTANALQRLLSTTTSAPPLQTNRLPELSGASDIGKLSFHQLFLNELYHATKKRGKKKAHATATGNSHLSFMQNKLSHYATDQRRKICPIAIIIAVHVLTVFDVLG